MRQVFVREDGIYLRASYTIEAALLLPLFLFAVLKGLLLGIDCYEDVRVASESMELLDTIEPVEQIWKMQFVQKGVEWVHGYTVSEKPEE